MQQVSALTSRHQDETRGRYAPRRAPTRTEPATAGDDAPASGGSVCSPRAHGGDAFGITCTHTRATWPAHDFDVAAGPVFLFPLPCPVYAALLLAEELELNSNRVVSPRCSVTTLLFNARSRKYARRRYTATCARRRRCTCRVAAIFLYRLDVREIEIDGNCS